MKLNESDRKEVVKFRLEKAKDTFAEVPILLENQFNRTATNRLYYACFYAATAMLVNDGFEAHTHNGVKRLLGLYINENKLEESLGKIYNRLFDMRQEGDYFDLVDMNDKDILPLLEPAEQFIKTIEKLINEKQ